MDEVYLFPCFSLFFPIEFFRRCVVDRISATISTILSFHFHPGVRSYLSKVVNYKLMWLSRKWWVLLGVLIRIKWNVKFSRTQATVWKYCAIENEPGEWMRQRESERASEIWIYHPNNGTTELQLLPFICMNTWTVKLLESLTWVLLNTFCYLCRNTRKCQ